MSLGVLAAMFLMGQAGTASVQHSGRILATWSSWDSQTTSRISSDLGDDADISDDGKVCHLYVPESKVNGDVDRLRKDKTLIGLLAGYQGNDALVDHAPTVKWTYGQYADLLVAGDTTGSKLSPLSGGLHRLAYEVADRPGSRIVAMWYRRRKDAGSKTYDLLVRLTLAHGETEFVGYQTSQPKKGWRTDFVSFVPSNG